MVAQIPSVKYFFSNIKPILDRDYLLLQSQAYEVMRYPVRIQASLLFVVPRADGTASN